MKTQYKEFGYADADPLDCGTYVFPAVLDLGLSLGPTPRVLDVGCGNGALAGQFVEHGCEVVGIDLSEEGIALARSAYPDARFEIAEADEHVLETLDEQPFDLVVSTEVVEHVYAPSAFAAGCFSALRPGGRFVLSTPYHGYLKNLAIAARGKFDSHVHPLVQGGHIKFWSRDTMHELLQQAGFVNFQFEGVGRVPYLWKSMVCAGDRPRTR